jgi:TonB family protein
MNTEVIRKDWVGSAVQERYRLQQWLGSFGQSGVFLCEINGSGEQKAAIKLFPANVEGSAACSAGWATAAGLSHPHLIRVLDTGRDRIQSTGVLYVVTEYAGEILSEILPERALSAAEVKEMLGPVLEALAYLHENGLVHGRLKPSNIMVVDDQLKLSSENIRGSAARVTPPAVLEIYDAPEKMLGRISPATDMWALGVTLVEALTRVPPTWNRSAQGDPVLPTGIPEPYAQIARECLRREPENRCTLDEVRACLESGTPIPHRPIKPVKPRVLSALAKDPATEQVTEPAKKPAAKSMATNRVALFAALATVLVVVLVIILAKSHHSTAPATSEETTGAPAAAQTSPEPEAAAPQPAAPQAQSPAPQSSVQPAQSAPAPAPQEQVQPAPSPVAAPTPGPTPAPTAAAGPAAKGAVAQQVMPDVPEKARNTIHGTVKTSIKVNVDANGAVSDASIESQGPSHYFANLALEAARSWKFTPSAPSVWVLHFAFRQTGTEVTPTKQTP